MDPVGVRTLPHSWGREEGSRAQCPAGPKSEQSCCCTCRWTQPVSSSWAPRGGVAPTALPWDPR